MVMSRFFSYGFRERPVTDMSLNLPRKGRPLNPRLLELYNKYQKDGEFREYFHQRYEQAFGTPFTSEDAPPTSRRQAKPAPPMETDSDESSSDEQTQQDMDDSSDSEPESDPEPAVHEVQGEHGISYQLSDTEEEF